MFESITEALTGIFGRMRGKGRLSEKNIREGMREVRLALLEADVHYKVVKDFVRRVTEKAVGEEVIRSVTPAQQVVKIVQDELTDLMGPSDPHIPFNPKGVTVIMLAGLQGSGKTTTCAKLATHLVRRGRNPLLVAADIQRPGAVEQLRILGEEARVPVYAAEGIPPPKICQRAVKEARKTGRDTVILDTAGRLHIDAPLMQELREIVKRTAPHQTYLVADAMTGQDAVNSASEFDRQLPLDGVILTKLDGDARGGAALSVKAVTGKPVKFVGVSERLDGLEEFHPDRMAQRILGMGDIVTLVEKAQAQFSEAEADEMRQKIMEKTFTLDDFLAQMGQVEKMGSFKDLIAMIPGLGSQMGNMDFDEGEIRRVKAIIQSMTMEEKEGPDIIDGSRRYRIARGSGTTTADVNELIKQFKAMRKMMADVMESGGLMGKVAGFQMKRAKRKRMKDQQQKKKKKKKRR
ncbi:MAG: signal recognition particle protein [Planctomycetota bacterium]|jgi:signal recognition particle subunit SRP54